MYFKINVQTIATYLVICKGDERKRSEGFGNEDVCDLPILHEELTKLIGRHVLSATPYKHLPAPHRLIRTLLLKVRVRL